MPSLGEDRTTAAPGMQARAERPGQQSAPAGDMLGAATQALGQGAVQRKVAQRALQRKEATASRHRTLAMGATGSEVTLAQSRLNQHGAAPVLVEDGVFGPKTRAATVAFQQAQGLSADGIIGDHTWAALDTPGSHSHGKGKASRGQHQNVLYDSNGYTLAAVPPGTTLATIKAQVEARKQSTPPDLTDAAVSGVTAGTDAEIFVWNTIARLGEQAQWGTETDLRTAIGFPPQGGGAAPIGLITLRIDPAGKATAQLLDGAQVAAPTQFATVALAIVKLKADFGFSDVRNGTASWSPLELGKVHAALSTLSGTERAALSGVALVREQQLLLPSGDPASGLFQSSAGVGASGAAARADTLSIADMAFASDNVGFIGGASNAASASFGTIVHEAGHAVETHALREAELARLKAQVQEGEDVTELNQKNNDANAAGASFTTEAAAATVLANQYGRADQSAMRAYFNAIDSAAAALTKLGQASQSAGIGALQRAAQAKISSRDTEHDKLQKAHPKNPALKDFAATQAKQDTWHTAVNARAQALIKLDAAKATTKAAEAKEKAATGSGGQSKRLSNFVAFVTAKKIEPLTDYARDNWPANPEEFYAEAFSLFRNDPEFLRSNAKALFDWFTQGKHLQ